MIYIDKKHSATILLLALCSIFALTSCGDDDVKGDFSNTGTTLETFEMYVSGVKVDTEALNVRSYFKPYDVMIARSYMTFTLAGDRMNVYEIASDYSVPFQFEGNSLYITQPQSSVWQYIGFGDANSTITIKDNYIYARKGNNVAINKSVLVETLDEAEVMRQNGYFTKIEDMAVGDTLMWCTTYSVFKK